jgi:hypothetical protein
MSVHIGYDFLLHVDGSVFAQADTMDWSYTFGNTEISSREDDGWDNFQSTGRAGGTLSVSGFRTRPGTVGAYKSGDDVLNSALGGTLDVSVSVVPQNLDASAYKQDFNCLITGIGGGAGSLSDKSPFSLDLIINSRPALTLV